MPDPLAFDLVELVVPGAAVALLALAAAAFRRIRRQVRLDRKLARVSSSARTTVDHDETIKLLEQSTRDVSLDQTIYRFLPSLSNTRMRLRRAGINADIKLYIFFVLAAAAGLSAAYAVPVIPAWGEPLAFAVGLHIVIDRVVIGLLISRRQKKMISQLAVAVDSMARGVQVGQSIESAILDASDQVEAPLRDKLLMIHKLTEVGISLPNALATVAQDIDLTEFDFFVCAITAQLHSGGSVVASLNNIVDIIRARETLMQRVAALSAEGKMSAYMLSALPVVMYVFINLLRPDYMRPLSTHPAGPYILYGAAITVVIGFAAMMRLARIKV
jgi:tight adherence protein B